MENVKEVSIIVKWSGNEYPMTDLTEQDTVAVLKHEIFKATHVRPERQKLLNLRHKGMYIDYRSAISSESNEGDVVAVVVVAFFISHIRIGKTAEDDVKLVALELKPNFKLMMVGSLEADIEDMCNVPYHNRDIVDDFDIEDPDEKSSTQFHNMDVSSKENQNYNDVIGRVHFSIL